MQPNIPKSILHTTAVCLVKGSADAVGAMHVINPTTDALARAPPTAVTAHASSGSACTVQQIPRSECEIDIQCVHDQLLRTSKHFMQYACTLGQSFAQSGRRASPGRIGRWRYGRRTKYPVRTLSQSVCTSPPPSFCSRTWSEGVPVLRRGSQAPGRVPLQLARSSGCSSTPLTTPSSRQTPPPPRARSKAVLLPSIFFGGRARLATPPPQRRRPCSEPVVANRMGRATKPLWTRTAPHVLHPPPGAASSNPCDPRTTRTP